MAERFRSLPDSEWDADAIAEWVEAVYPPRADVQRVVQAFADRWRGADELEPSAADHREYDDNRLSVLKVRHIEGRLTGEDVAELYEIARRNTPRHGQDRDLLATSQPATPALHGVRAVIAELRERARDLRQPTVEDAERVTLAYYADGPAARDDEPGYRRMCRRYRESMLAALRESGATFGGADGLNANEQKRLSKAWQLYQQGQLDREEFEGTVAEIAERHPASAPEPSAADEIERIRRGYELSDRPDYAPYVSQAERDVHTLLAATDAANARAEAVYVLLVAERAARESAAAKLAKVQEYCTGGAYNTWKDDILRMLEKP